MKDLDKDPVKLSKQITTDFYRPATLRRLQLLFHYLFYFN